MINQNILDQINQKIELAFKNSPFKDMEANMKAIMASIFSKLDLVTREEFEIQKKVLLKTSQKLKELEQKLEELSK